jgi:hypothetical protein
MLYRNIYLKSRHREVPDVNPQALLRTLKEYPSLGMMCRNLQLQVWDSQWDYTYSSNQESRLKLIQDLLDAMPNLEILSICYADSTSTELPWGVFQEFRSQRALRGEARYPSAFMGEIMKMKPELTLWQLPYACIGKPFDVQEWHMLFAGKGVKVLLKPMSLNSLRNYFLGQNLLR